APARPFIHTIWRSPDGTRFAALSKEKSFIYDAGGKLVRSGPGGTGMRWRKDSKAMVLTVDDKLIELDAKSGAQKALAQGLPFKSNRESSELALIDPDYFGDKVIYTLFRVAVDPEDGY